MAGAVSGRARCNKGSSVARVDDAGATTSGICVALVQVVDVAALVPRGNAVKSVLERLGYPYIANTCGPDGPAACLEEVESLGGGVDLASWLA